MQQLVPHLLSLLRLLSIFVAGAVGAKVDAAGFRTDEHRYPSFDQFIKVHGRSYRSGSAEYTERRKLYEQRLTAARNHNERPAGTGPGARRWTAGINDLSDRTEAELASLRGYVRSARPGGARASGASPLVARMAAAGSFLRHRPNEPTTAAAVNSTLNSTVALAALPSEKFWTSLGATRTIHNQGGCGSCWAIAAATVLEAHAEIHTGKSRTFSAQQLVSCVPNPQQCGGSGGCGGATIELAMDWVMDHGCATEYEVPYSGDNGHCTAKAPDTSASGFVWGKIMGGNNGNGAASFGMHGWERLPENLYAPLLRAVNERGPVGVSVAASGWSSYSEGIYDWCSKDAIIDHAVMLIGYGEDSHWGKYWLIQNSWGRNWGESGTIRLLRKDDDDRAWCGTDNKPEMGSGCLGGPPQVTVCGMCGILYDTVVPHFG